MPGNENNAREEAILSCFESLYRTALRLTGDKVHAEDLVQETYCALGVHFLSCVGFQASSFGCFEYCEQC